MWGLLHTQTHNNLQEISTSPTWYNVVDYSEGINEKDVK